MELGLKTFDRNQLESLTLAFEQIQQRVELLWSLSLEERKKLPGLQPAKADIILIGSAIHEAVMSSFNLTDLHVSTRGFRFAALF
jgi:exopolyphosphatase/guanosine-5'-triphosphate,3'-diphosphate pyrophosphatase